MLCGAVALVCERVAATRQAIDSSGIPFILVARTDRLNIGQSGGLAEARERAKLYREAATDCLFAPGARDLETVAETVRQVDGPLSVVTGLGGSAVPLSQVRGLGVRSVSTGGMPCPRTVLPYETSCRGDVPPGDVFIC